MASSTLGLDREEESGRCSLSLAYQAIRNMAAATAIAGGRASGFLLLYDERNPYFRGTGGWPGWTGLFRSLAAESPVPFNALSLQELLTRVVVDENVRTWAREKHGLVARMWLDRLASEPLLSALQGEPYNFLPGVVRHQLRPGLLDLRFRSRCETGWSEATLYLGQRAAARLACMPGGALVLHGPAKDLGNMSPEGLVHARLCARTDVAVLDREVAFRFVSQSDKDAALDAVRGPIREAAVVLAAAQPSLGKPPKFGQEADAIAVEPGRLAIIEVKAGTDTTGIRWAPAQVSVYTRLFTIWVEQDPDRACAMLGEMLGQRVQLGLAPQIMVELPIEIVPVVAVGSPWGNVAREGALTVQKMLLSAGLGFPNLEVWEIGDDGSPRMCDWFGRNVKPAHRAGPSRRSDSV